MNMLLSYLLNRHIWINPITVIQGLLIKYFFKVKNKRILFLDIDGTIWKDEGRGTILMKPKINLATQGAVQEARSRGFTIVLVTNQTYFCYQPRVTLKTLLHYAWLMTKIIVSLRVVALLVCHHHPNANFEPLKRNCDMRKPSPGMLKKLRNVFPYNPDASIFIGDRITDIACASLGGIKRSFLIQNPHMLERNVHISTSLPHNLIFSVIPMNQSKWPIFE